MVFKNQINNYIVNLSFKISVLISLNTHLDWLICVCLNTWVYHTMLD